MRSAVPRSSILHARKTCLCACERAISLNGIDGINRCPPVPSSAPVPPRCTGSRTDTPCTQPILLSSQNPPSVRTHAYAVRGSPRSSLIRERILPRRKLQIGDGLRGELRSQKENEKWERHGRDDRGVIVPVKWGIIYSEETLSVLLSCIGRSVIQANRQI